MHIQQGYMN